MKKCILNNKSGIDNDTYCNRVKSKRDLCLKKIKTATTENGMHRRMSNQESIRLYCF